MTVLLKTTSFKDTQKRPNNSCFKKKRVYKDTWKRSNHIFYTKTTNFKKTLGKD